MSIATEYICRHMPWYQCGNMQQHTAVLLSTCYSHSPNQPRAGKPAYASEQRRQVLTRAKTWCCLMMLPEGLIWKDEGRLAYCIACCAPVPASSEKLVKQHCKSRSHKNSVQRGLVAAPQAAEASSRVLPAVQQHSSTVTSPKDYHTLHLEALHIVGTFPDDDPCAGLYYTLQDSSSCLLHSNNVPSAAAAGILPTAHNTGYPNAEQHVPASPKHKLHTLRSKGPFLTDTAACCMPLAACAFQDLPPRSSSSSSSRTPLAADTTPAAAEPIPRQQCEIHAVLKDLHLQQSPLYVVPQQQQQQQQQRPSWPPPFAVRPKAAVAAGLPFLTTVCGSIPFVPDDVAAAIQWYCQPGACRLPDIDIAGVNQQVKSWSHAAKLLRGAAAAAAAAAGPLPASTGANSSSSSSSSEGAASGCQCRQPFWASLVADIAHPPWWPKTGHVPTYDIVIVGGAASGIGLHRDVDHSYCCNPPPVATYLSIVRGKKHVILLPPEQTLFPVDDKLPFPLHPSPELLQAIKSAGGAYFDLQPTPDGSPVTLFMPMGWLHWLVGGSDWHVVFGDPAT